MVWNPGLLEQYEAEMLAKSQEARRIEHEQDLKRERMTYRRQRDELMAAVKLIQEGCAACDTATECRDVIANVVRGLKL